MQAVALVKTYIARRSWKMNEVKVGPSGIQGNDWRKSAKATQRTGSWASVQIGLKVKGGEEEGECEFPGYQETLGLFSLYYWPCDLVVSEPQFSYLLKWG